MRIAAEIERAGLSLFVQALDHEGDERDSWLASACEGDEILHAYVLKLLAADACTSQWLLGSNGQLDDEVPPGPPTQLGPYRLQELIGAGGMGLVYRAQRNDGLFEQAVAIKFIRRLPGLAPLEPLIDSERKLLARVEHPGIARILDGGTTAGGLPYLVMEFVRGSALDQFVVEHRLDLRRRIALLGEACAAVTHAHSNLILHCDIKPANLLVTPEGRLKLIDFGVARIQDVVDASRPDGFTRAYTSPQRLDGAPPTVADDIYSLGVVLRELILAAEHSGPRRVPADLEAIARKATAPERADRYSSVAALDEDLRLWLERRPVAAAGPSWRYRARKMIERHPWRVAGVSASLIGLLAALMAVSFLYRRAEVARIQSEERFSEVRSLAKFMLFDLYDRLESMPRSLALRRDVADISQQYLSKLVADAGVSSDVQIETLEGLLRLASVQGTGTGSKLNQLAQARANLARADVVAGRLQSAGLAEWRLAHLRARILLQEVRVRANIDNDVRAAEPSLNEARVQLDRALLQAPQDAKLRWTNADWYAAASWLRCWQGRYAEAQKLAHEAHNAFAAFAPGQRTTVASRILEAEIADALAESYFYSGEESRAERLYTEEVAQLEQASESFPDNGAIARYKVRAQWALGTTLLNNHKVAEGLLLTDESRQGARALSIANPDDSDAQHLTAVAELAYAQALGAAGRNREAINAFAENIAQRRIAAAADPENAGLARSYAVALFALGDFEADIGNRSEACRLYAQGFASFDALKRAGKLTEVDRSYAMEQAQQRSKSLSCR